MRQLTLRYGHFRFAKTGILDAFFERYRREGEAKGMPFLEWVERTYDPEALKRDFRPASGPTSWWTGSCGGSRSLTPPAGCRRAAAGGACGHRCRRGR